MRLFEPGDRVWMTVYKMGGFGEPIATARWGRVTGFNDFNGPSNAAYRVQWDDGELRDHRHDELRLLFPVGF